MITIYFQYLRLSYCELLPSVSIGNVGFMLSWLWWGVSVQFVREDDGQEQ